VNESYTSQINCLTDKKEFDSNLSNRIVALNKFIEIDRDLNSAINIAKRIRGNCITQSDGFLGALKNYQEMYMNTSNSCLCMKSLLRLMQMLILGKDNLMINQMINHESFAIFSNLEVVGDIDGMKVYSSDVVKKDYLEIIQREKVLNPVIGEFSDLVKKDIIIPCYVSSGVFDRIKYKARSATSDIFDKLKFKTKPFSTEAEDSLMGAFIPTKNKIYILTDRETKFLVWTDLKETNVSYTTLHELCHYISANYNQEFYVIFKKTNALFYHNFFRRFCKANVSLKTCDEINSFMLKNCEWNKNVNVKYFSSLHNFLTKKLEFEKVKNADKYSTTIVSCIKIFLKDISTYITLAKQQNKSVLHFASCLYNSYIDLGISYPLTMPVQEFFCPSEIAAVLSLEPRSQHYQAIKVISRKS